MLRDSRETCDGKESMAGLRMTGNRQTGEKSSEVGMYLLLNSWRGSVFGTIHIKNSVQTTIRPGTVSSHISAVASVQIEFAMQSWGTNGPSINRPCI